MLTVVGFYTIGTAYEAEAERLMASLRRAGMVYDIKAVEPVGDWDANVAMKCAVLIEARAHLTGPLLYVDVDAVFHENCGPYFQELDLAGVDFAAHWFQGPAGGYDRDCNDDHFLSGTMFFRDSPVAWELLRQWARENLRQMARGNVQGQGQKNLQTVLDDGWVTGLKIHRLPGRYCRVFDKPWAYPADEPIVIEHLIASRENRGASAGNVNQARQRRIEEIDTMLSTPQEAHA